MRFSNRRQGVLATGSDVTAHQRLATCRIIHGMLNRHTFRRAVRVFEHGAVCPLVRLDEELGVHVADFGVGPRQRSSERRLGVQIHQHDVGIDPSILHVFHATVDLVGAQMRSVNHHPHIVGVVENLVRDGRFAGALAAYKNNTVLPLGRSAVQRGVPDGLERLHFLRQETAGSIRERTATPVGVLAVGVVKQPL